MLTLLVMAAFVISVLFAIGEIVYRRSWPRATGAFVALFSMLLLGCIFVR